MKISTRELKFVFILLPFFKLTGFTEIGFISKIFDVLLAISVANIFLNIIKIKYRPSRFSANKYVIAIIFICKHLYSGRI